ncbi:porin [Xanthobacter oligotrophicus]|uniref:porin n=1 Tax=Xanthobacter oligotrophicus TaxID=2607286 RepID=UPI0011F1C071|nr:porin [Xanthobacter oligotrophicus]MCG5237346.1 porin [Xanthobacter oligotrophicus]
MKMVKSLLLGSAAGLVAVAGAQAADLPVKAKAVEYVKVCTAYGAGYYYIPGTDTCIKIGGYARFDTYVNAIGTFNPNITSAAAVGFQGPGSGAGGTTFGYPFKDADDPDYVTRVRGTVDFDARTQTDYGTLRSYVRFGAEWNSQQIGTSTASGGATWGTGSGVYFERAFIQFSGFTFGYTQSFFDSGLNYMLTTPLSGSNTWTTLAAYTAQFGNGFSATLSLEDAANRTTGVQLATSTGSSVVGTWYNISTGATGLSYANYSAGQQAPDIVANLRIDQAWGSAQLSGALHQVVVENPGYAGFTQAGLTSSDSWGWAIGGTVEFKLPFLAAGDSIFFQAGYEEGAANYLGLSGTSQGRATGVGSIDLNQVGQNIVASGAFYTVADAVGVNQFGDYSLTKGWQIQGQFRHYWTPGLRSALYAGYVSYETPDNVVAANNFNLWQVGVNTVWSPVKNLDIAAEAVYSKVDGSVPLGNYAATNASTGLLTSNSLVGGSTDIWSGGVRVQRNF